MGDSLTARMASSFSNCLPSQDHSKQISEPSVRRQCQISNLKSQMVYPQADQVDREEAAHPMGISGPLREVCPRTRRQNVDHHEQRDLQQSPTFASTFDIQRESRLTTTSQGAENECSRRFRIAGSSVFQTIAPNRYRGEIHIAATEVRFRSGFYRARFDAEDSPALLVLFGMAFVEDDSIAGLEGGGMFEIDGQSARRDAPNCANSNAFGIWESRVATSC